MSTAVVSVFVRHSSDCKYRDDETWKRCGCRKHLRWTHNGKQYRRKAGTRSWEQAEQKKRELEDQLAGKEPEQKPESGARTIESAVEVFLKDKKVQGVSAGVLAKYTRELARLREYMEAQQVFTVQRITRESLTGFASHWEDAYPSSYTRAKVRERCRSFFRYCYEAQWLPRIPAIPKINIEEPETMPLTKDEYKRLLDSCYSEIADPEQRSKVHALFQLMRHSGLAIGDALTLERADIQQDKAKGMDRVVTSRQKTGVHVSVPIPPAVAAELRKVANGNAQYVFWSGYGAPESISKNWMKYYIAPCFKAAKIERKGHMMSHRLRDTFAVDLLEKGVPLEEVSKLLGHESIKTTERHYAKWIKGRQDRLDALVIATWARRRERRRSGEAQPLRNARSRFAGLERS